MKFEEIQIRRDVLAGLISAAVVIPKAMAYAAIAGLPVQVGLYTALIPLIVYAIFGSSRTLSVSTTTTMAILVGTLLAQVSPSASPDKLVQVSSTIALAVGGVLLLASVFRFGFIADFISEPVLVGFKAGIGLVIILDQLPKVLGVHFERGSFFQNLGSLIRALPETSFTSLALGGTMIALLGAMKYWRPSWPGPLIVVVIGIGLAKLGVFEKNGIAGIGDIPQGLPSFVFPDFQVVELVWPSILGIALMSFTETIAAGRAFAPPRAPPISANQELFATGIANVAGGFFGAMPAGGGTSQTAVNLHAGAQSQFSEVVTATSTLLTMLILAPFLSLMPQPVLAAIVIVYSIGLIQRKDFLAIRRVRWTEFYWAVTALLGVVLLGTMKGILVAIVLSLVALSQQVVDPPVRMLGRKPGNRTFRPFEQGDEVLKGLIFLRVEGRVFFLNAFRIGEKIRRLVAAEDAKVVVLDLSAVPDLEYTALKMLIEGERHFRELGVMVWLSGLNPEVYRVIRNSSFADVLGQGRIHDNNETALSYYRTVFSQDRNSLSCSPSENFIQ